MIDKKTNIIYTTSFVDFLTNKLGQGEIIETLRAFKEYGVKLHEVAENENIDFWTDVIAENNLNKKDVLVIELASAACEIAQRQGISAVHMPWVGSQEHNGKVLLDIAAMIVPN